MALVCTGAINSCLFYGRLRRLCGRGVRVARVLVLYLQGKRELKRVVHPNLVYPIKWGRTVLDERVIGSIWAFFPHTFWSF
ncbi:Trk system potassium uptake protein TrkH [Rodentibacter pneumotropicus]|uniref:Trk system potassium uptake protein TrkH n=1 Tax=Rodentibacter pneumotropicus TaxID=758 RepID=A0A3S4TXY5_9PAST|nr:Trk system potassium uptake protein TrkH [Rodentibacter pneumotropicus]